METTVNNGMCRCCASEGAFKDVKSTYHWMGEEEIYADMLRDCFDISLNVSEQGTDGGICEVCITQLRNAINFKKQVLHTEEQFKKHLQNKTLFRPNIVKVEVNEDDDSDDNNASGDDGFSGAEYEVPIKTEVDDPKPKKRGAKATTSRAKKTKTDNGETSTKRDQEKPIEKTEAKNKESPKSSRIKGQISDLAKARKKVVEELKKHQSNVKEILISTNATPFLRKGYIGYMCCYCDTQCAPADLKKHNLDTHGDKYNAAPPHLQGRNDRYRVNLDITDLRCKLCNIKIESLEEMLQHLKNEHKRTIFTDINNRILPFKFDGETVKCCICPSIFDTFKVLLEHMHTHYRNYICKECDLGFVTKACLLTHALKHKLGDFKCTYCSKAFDTRQKMKAHEKTVHIIKHMNNKCWYCGEKFKSHQNKINHLAKMHGVQSKVIKCRACDRIMPTKKALADHTRRDHLMERKHKCSQCEMEFFTKGELTLHHLKHTGVKEFKCDFCLKAFGRKFTLLEHMKIHNNVKRFKCEHCGQKFVQKCSWKGHMRNRHGEII